MAQHQRLPDKDLRAELKKIYTDQRGDLPDFSKIEKIGDSRVWKRLAVLFFVSGILLSLLWGGFFILGQSSKTADDIKITFAGPSDIAPIKEYEFTVTAQNVSSMDLVRATFELNLPPNFFLTSSNPELDLQHRTSIGILAQKEKKQISFKGYFLAKEKETVSLSGGVVYHPQNFNATFESDGSYTATVTDGPFTGSVDGPDKLLSGDEAEFNLSYAIKEGEKVDNPAISVQLPPGFVITTSTLQRLQGAVWPAVFAKDSREGAVDFKGLFSADIQGQQEVIFLLGVMKDNKFYATKEIKAPVELLGSEMDIGVQLNGLALADSPTTTYLHFGDLLTYSIDLKSKSTETLKNVRVLAHLEAEPELNGDTVVLWPSAISSPAGTVENKVLTWTARDFSSFRSFKPSASEHVEGSVRLRAGPFPISLTDYHLRFWVEVAMDGVGRIAKSRHLTTKVVDIVLLSDTAFQSEARYFAEDGVVLSTGPLPPRVDQTTTYRVRWNIENSLHELENVNVSEMLGDNVTLTGKNLIPAGTFSFDGSTKTVSWSLNRWPTTIKNLEISFEVALKPNAKEIGTTPELTSASVFKAKDTVTQTDINLTAPALSTNITNDAFAVGKAMVQE